jgi:hypothetical protein|tara:strand:+ start:5136 stop:5321 length:186 start_codon:yes stop_codon:yes gene_type:complete
MPGLEKIGDIIKQNRDILGEEAIAKANCCCCGGGHSKDKAHECTFCDDCDITWRRMGVFNR